MSQDLKIALLQANLHWEDIEANLAMFEEKVWQIEEPADLIGLPEMFTTGFSMNPQKFAEPVNSKTFRWMKQQAAQTRAVVAGSYIIQEKGKFFNRFYAVYPDGSSVQYDKKHLFGLAGERNDYTAGVQKITFEVKGWKVRPLICYDLRFPVWARSRKEADGLYEYDLLLYVANWPKPRINAWDTLLAARAIENISYCAGVNRIGVDGVSAEYTGHSVVYNYKGDQISFSEEEVIVSANLSRAELENFRERFPFQEDADGFELSL